MTDSEMDLIPAHCQIPTLDTAMFPLYWIILRNRLFVKDNEGKLILICFSLNKSRSGSINSFKRLNFCCFKNIFSFWKSVKSVYRFICIVINLKSVVMTI